MQPGEIKSRHGVRRELVEQGLLAAIEQLTPHPDNPNDGDPDAISESLIEHGQYRPIVVWRKPGRDIDVILAGNTTYAAAMQLGWTHIARTWIEADTEQQAVKIMLADNRYARLAQMNRAQELALLRSLDDLTGTGYTPDSMGDLERHLAALAATALDPTAEWDRSGMPGYASQDLMPAYSMVVHFRSEADADKFSEKIFGRERQKSQWWPESDGHRGHMTELSIVAAESE